MSLSPHPSDSSRTTSLLSDPLFIIKFFVYHLTIIRSFVYHLIIIKFFAYHLTIIRSFAYYLILSDILHITSHHQILRSDSSRTTSPSSDSSRTTSPSSD